jgi:hypothetical protein
MNPRVGAALELPDARATDSPITARARRPATIQAAIALRTNPKERLKRFS